MSNKYGITLKNASKLFYFGETMNYCDPFIVPLLNISNETVRKNYIFAFLALTAVYLQQLTSVKCASSDFTVIL